MVVFKGFRGSLGDTERRIRTFGFSPSLAGSPPYQRCGSRKVNRRAVAGFARSSRLSGDAYASREWESRGRIVWPSRRDRAQPDIGTPCTTRSTDHAQPPHCPASSVGWVWISPKHVCGIVHRAAARNASAAGAVGVPAPVGSWQVSPSRVECAARADNDRRLWCWSVAGPARQSLLRLGQGS